VKEKQANVVSMSALLTTTMLAMKGTIDALKAAGMRDRVKVLIAAHRSPAVRGRDRR